MIQTCYPDPALWYPGKKLEGFEPAQLSARAQEIARSREELVKLIQDLPDSELELSFSDLVEKSESFVNDKSIDKDGDLEGKESVKVKEVRKKRFNSTYSFGSNGNGVFLKVYMPASLTRSLNAPHSGHSSPKNPVDYTERERSPVMFGCLPALWVCKGDKSRKQLAEKNHEEKLELQKY